MIECRQISKTFDHVPVLEQIDLQIEENKVFAMLGTNGAGKSTLLRVMTGIYRADGGGVTIDGEPVADNPGAKEKFFFIPDDLYFFPNANCREMATYYATIYRNFDKQRYFEFLRKFGLDEGRRINTFSKGMKRQAALLAGICAGTKYLFCDETFDGLDPVMRQGIKALFAGEMDRREFTPIVTSHNLRELEDVFDHVGILHKGGILLSRDLDDMKESIRKVQCVYGTEEDRVKAEAQLQILRHDVRGSLHMYTLRGTETDIRNTFGCVDTVFCETLPLTLEEIFISETEVAGYDVKALILD
jgi:ABC-2 type transport system ATP-binding protein